MALFTRLLRSSNAGMVVPSFSRIPARSFATKAMKATGQPKRPASAYIIFSKEARSAVVSANPTLKPTQVMTALGAAWRQLPASKRKPYEEKSVEAKAQYEKQVKSFIAANPKSDLAKKALKAMQPKRPPSAYLLFMSEARKSLGANHGMKPQEVVQTLAKNWKALSDAQKKPYQDQYAKLKADYEKRKAAEEAGKPQKIKRPVSGYLIFSQEMRPEVKREHPNAKPQEVVKLLAEKWRDLADKAPYQQKAAERKAEYIKAKAAAAGSEGDVDPEEVAKQALKNM